MSEEELLHLLDVPPDAWSPFYLATRALLCAVGGLLNISDNVMDKAVRARYLKKDADRVEVHRQLLTFFDRAPAELVPNERKVAELPFQMLHAHDARRLERFLLDMPSFLALDRLRHQDLHYFWRALAADGTHEPGAAFGNLGDKYSASVEKHKDELMRQVAKKCAPPLHATPSPSHAPSFPSSMPPSPPPLVGQVQ